MKCDIATFFSISRHLFGVCPKSNQIFRLSDCKVFLRKKPMGDWLDILERKQKKLDAREEKLNAAEEQLRENARAKGRKLAQDAIRKIDPIFTPRRLNPDDAKVLFHPIDYVVFHGMKSPQSVQKIVFLDRIANNKEHRSIQRSIEKTIEAENYEWQTLRIDQEGNIKCD